MDKAIQSLMINVSQSRKCSNKSSKKSTQVSKIFTKENETKCSNVSMESLSLPPEEILSFMNSKNVFNILPFKLYSKKQNKDRCKQRLNISIYKKYKIISTDLKKRIRVQDTVNDIIAVSDIDDDFYSCVDGRPIQLHVPIFRSLKEYVNKLLHIKQDIRVKKDSFFNFEINYRNEMRIYDLTVKRLTNQIKSFDTFISEDYQKSMTYLRNWDKLRSQLERQAQELQNVALEKFTLISKIIGLEYKYGLQQRYGRFLYYLSPPLWRISNRDFARSCEIEAKGFDYANSNEDDNFAVIFERVRNICFYAPVKPVLYFTRPKDLIDVFNTMETQQLHYYTHVHHLAPYTKMLKNGITSLKDIIIKDSASIASSIKRYENYLLFSEQRCDQLEIKFFKILYGLFYETVAAPDVLKLTIHLQFCYEKVTLEKPLNMDIIALAKSLEKIYMDFAKRLDSISNDAVRRAMAKCIDIEKLQNKRANNAAIELRLFHRLERELLHSHRIFVDNIYKPIKCRTYAPKNDKSVYKTKNKNKEKKKSLTEAEVEYLMFFTDWNEHEDPAVFLQSLNLNDKIEEAGFDAT